MTAAGLIVAVATILIIAADIILAFRGGFAATISWWVWTTSVKYPIVPFAFGLLFGHFFWNQELNVVVQGGCSQ